MYTDMSERGKVRFLYHQCGCWFDVRGNPFVAVRFSELNMDGYIMPELTRWMVTEVSTKPCPWHS